MTSAIMGTEGKQGLGDRHRYGHLLTKGEQRERELAQAKREVDRLQHRLASIESTLKVVNKLSAPYVRKPEPSMPLRRIIERSGKT
jgi:hypothetical protein